MTLSIDELLARGFDLDGTDTGDTILGTNTTDRIDGGAGNDYLDGGLGDDTYSFGTGSGQDTINDYDTTPGNTDTIRLADDLLPSGIHVTRDFNNLYLNILGTSDTLTLSNWYTREDGARIEQVAFADADNTVWDAAQLEALAATATGEGDFLIGTDGADTLQGLGGVDQLAGMEGSDTLIGGADNDILNGGEGNDTLAGGTGDDILSGGGGDDTYLYNPGDGLDFITETGGTDTLRFGAGILPGNITFTKSGPDITLVIGGADLPGQAPDQVTIRNWGADSAARIERVEFADDPGTVWDDTQLNARASTASTQDDFCIGTDGDETLQGLAGNDTLSGLGGTDTLDGGAGNDYLDGGTGDDIYLFGRGSGRDAIGDHDATSDNTDTVQLAAGLTPDDIRVTRDFDNLYLSIADIGDTLAIKNWFTWGDAARIERVAFADADNTVWDAAQLEALAAAGSGQDDFLIGSNHEDTLQGLGGDDRLAGTEGRDTLLGGAGNDTYYFNIGCGQDEIGDESGIDTLAFGAGIAPDNITLEFPSGADLLIRYGGYGDSVLIRGGLDGSIENISFAGENISFDGENITPGGGLYSLEQLIAMRYGMTVDVPGMAGISSATPNPVPVELLYTGDYRDAIVGYSRDTTYLYDGEEKRDILDLGGYDTIQFGEGITPDRVTVNYAEDDREPDGPRFHVLVDGETAFSIADGERGAIERYRFMDGSWLTHQQMVDQSGGIEVAPAETAGKTIDQYGPMIAGTDGNDIIYDGDIPGVTYIAGKGDDTLNVYVGDNCNYVFNLGDGSDVTKVAANDAVFVARRIA